MDLRNVVYVISMYATSWYVMSVVRVGRYVQRLSGINRILELVVVSFV